jgi:hypothetical protein
MSKTTATVGVIEQVRVATGNLPALIVGGILGGVVPVASYQLAHNEYTHFWSIKTLLILGALVFSAKSVMAWTKRAFADTYKALGWTVLVEGVMLNTDAHWLSFTMCGLLIAVNTVATGCNLALQDMPKKPKSKKLGSSAVANDNGIAKRNRKVA